MPDKLRLVYIVHTLSSDWNNGNAHFQRGLMRALAALGHDITIFEPATEWSLENLRTEPDGQRSLAGFHRTYPDLNLQTFPPNETPAEAHENWRNRLRHADIVLLHEWTPPTLAQLLLTLRDQLSFRLLFHDTHHRASSSPGQIALFGLQRFDGILAFGDVLRTLYRERFGIRNVWTLHEAADTTVFHPIPSAKKETAAVWIGNWGDDERSAEITEFFLKPAAALTPAALTPPANFTIYGVRYPGHARQALERSHVHYGGYLPNLDAPAIYARARLTVHIPRRQYSTVMPGIPTIRVFEALACGIPLLSAPWQDTERLFRPDDLCFVRNAAEMTSAMQSILTHPEAAAAQAAADRAQRGLETILARHTCNHRAQELTHICQELLS